jgi:hypothetical protein
MQGLKTVLLDRRQSPAPSHYNNSWHFNPEISKLLHCKIFTQCFIPQMSLINLQFSLIHYISDHTPSWGIWNIMYCTVGIHKFEIFHVLQQNVSYRLNDLTLYNELLRLKTEGYILVILIQKLALQPSRTIFNFGSNGISKNSILEYRTESFKYSITNINEFPTRCST